MYAHLVQSQSKYLIRKVRALREALLAAKCKALGLLLQKRVKQNKKNTFLKEAQQKYTYMMIIQALATAK